MKPKFEALNCRDNDVISIGNCTSLVRDLNRALDIECSRDLQNEIVKSQSCGKTHLETELNIDHIIPLAKGGSNDISNLQSLCRTCNLIKKDRFDDRFRRGFS
jgi:5-methylcytosine-specific restriction enzyme A